MPLPTMSGPYAIGPCEEPSHESQIDDVDWRIREAERRIEEQKRLICRSDNPIESEFNLRRMDLLLALLHEARCRLIEAKSPASHRTH